MDVSLVGFTLSCCHTWNCHEEQIIKLEVARIDRTGTESFRMPSNKRAPTIAPAQALAAPCDPLGDAGGSIAFTFPTSDSISFDEKLAFRDI